VTASSHVNAGTLSSDFDVPQSSIHASIHPSSSTRHSQEAKELFSLTEQPGTHTHTHWSPPPAHPSARPSIPVGRLQLLTFENCRILLPLCYPVDSLPVRVKVRRRTTRHRLGVPERTDRGTSRKQARLIDSTIRASFSILSVCGVSSLLDPPAPTQSPASSNRRRFRRRMTQVEQGSRHCKRRHQSIWRYDLWAKDLHTGEGSRR